jgi:hypothetical protein
MRSNKTGHFPPGSGVVLSLAVMLTSTISFAADPGQAPVHGGHKPLFILSNWGSGGASIPANTATALDNPTTVNCTKANGCTIFIGSTVSLFQTTNFVHWSVCATIDGSNANPSCPIQDTNVGNIVGSWRQTFTVAQGTHTVQTFVTQTGTATLGSWEVDYTVTAP